MPKIMIIEDNENIKNELIDFLKRYGYEAYGSNDFENIAQQALTAIKTIAPKVT